MKTYLTEWKWSVCLLVPMSRMQHPSSGGIIVTSCPWRKARLVPLILLRGGSSNVQKHQQSSYMLLLYDIIHLFCTKKMEVMHWHHNNIVAIARVPFWVAKAHMCGVNYCMCDCSCIWCHLLFSIMFLFSISPLLFSHFLSLLTPYFPSQFPSCRCLHMCAGHCTCINNIWPSPWR